MNSFGERRFGEALMVGNRTAALCAVLFLIFGLLALPAAAATWYDVGTAYNDGTTLWKGTTYIPVPPDPLLSGYAEWAVYAPGEFPFSGYTPTPNEFTYVYQIHGTGSTAISNFSVAIDNAADNIGAFVDSGNGLTGDRQPLTPMNLYPPPGGSASWDFTLSDADPGILAGQSSWALVFSSPHTPWAEYAVIINHGTFRQGDPIPSPSPNVIPEPATLWLVVSGVGLMLAGWRLRRR
jgi:hypothetical protein